MPLRFTFRRIIHLFLAFPVLLSWQVSSALAQDIAVIKSAEIKPYAETMHGYRKLCDYNITEYNLSEIDGKTILRRIERTRPDLIFTIGLNALKLSKNTKDIPIVFSMVSNPEAILDNEAEISGVSMNVSAIKQLSALLSLLPNTRKIGIVYDPGKSSALFEEAREASAMQGVTLVSRQVSSPKDVPYAIKQVMHEVDAFWMIPDSSVIFTETLEFLMLTSFEKKIPILTFSDIYLEMGALISLNIDTRSIGRQACGLTKMILSGSHDIKDRIRPPSKPVLSINSKRASEFDIDPGLTRRGSR